MARACGNIQIVESDGNRGGDAQARRFREQIFVHFFGKQANQRVFRRHTLEQFLARNVVRGGPIIRLEVLVENFSRRFEEAVGHKDFGASHATLRRSAGIRGARLVYTNWARMRRGRESAGGQAR